MTHLKIGDKAPDFSCKNQNGQTVSLSDFLGKKLIIYFYPKDLTPGCTQESCNLRDNYALLKKEGFEILGVSVDNEKMHQKFIKKYQLPFSLLADIDKKMVNDYGVWGDKKLFGIPYIGIHRVTFAINEKGYINLIIEKVDTGNHSEQILKNY